MTDQRNRVTTDPGLGPIEREYASTLRSMRAAEPVPEDEIPGAPVYYEPKPLHAVSDHKTLELETVKLATDIDPRKLPTELKLRRPVLHVLPASDPNWPAPSPQPLPLSLSEATSGSPQYDSNWPPPETVLTTSQPPLAARRRSYIPLTLFVMLCGSLLLVLGASAWRRSPVSSVAAHSAQRAQPARLTTVAAAPLPRNVQALPSARPAPPLASADLRATADPRATAVAPAPVADSIANSLPAPHHAPLKPNTASPAPFPASSPSASPAPSIANSSSLSASPTAKPKRAIY